MRFGRLSLGLGLKAVAVLAVAAPWGVWAQVTVRPGAYAGVDAAGHAVTVEAALRGMTAQAVVMFVGTVTGVRRVGVEGFAAGAGVVEVTFAVERGMRGVDDGETYVLREWGGLWSATEKRYAVGSRLLMLLHAPGAAGLSSPVGGMDGAIPVKGTSPLVAAETGTAAVDAPVVDLRWLAAKLARPVVYSNRAAGQAMAQTRVVRAVATGQAMAAERTATAESMLRAAGSQGTTAEIEVAAMRDVTVRRRRPRWRRCCR